MVKVTLRKDGVTRRTLLGSLATAGAAAVAMPWTVRQPWAASPIRFGVISPLTGAWTVYGKAHFSGFELAVDEINKAGGVLGRPVEIVVGDSKTEPRIVVEQANRLVRQERVDFLAGTFSSAERNAAGPVVQQTGKLLLYPTWYEGQSQEFLPRRVQQEHLHVRARALAAGLAVHRLHDEELRQEVLPDRLGLRLAARDQQDVQGEVRRAGRAGRRRGLHPVQHAAVQLGAARHQERRDRGRSSTR